MAAPRSRRSSGSSSGGEEAEEALARLREAAWDPGRPSGAALLSPTAGTCQKNKVLSAASSVRIKIQDQGQDANELQTTPGFRAHVAKKLEALLDSSITTLEHPLQTRQTNLKAPETEDDGFRLFSSSVPGDCGSPEPSPVGRKRPQPSSSSELDSDQEWQRFREAAVSVADILQQSGLPGVLPGSSQDLSCQTDEPSGKKIKKKKKKKEKQGEVKGEEEGTGEEGTVETVCSPCNGTVKREEHAEIVKKKKQKKKKKKKPAEARTE